MRIKTLLPDRNTQKCRLKKVLYVPKLSYNLLSVSKVAEAGNTTNFSGSGCEIMGQEGKVIAFVTKVGRLYYLEYCRREKVNVMNSDNKERLLHHRYGHLGEQNLQKLAKTGMIEQFDYNAKKQLASVKYVSVASYIAILSRKVKDVPQNHWSLSTQMCVARWARSFKVEQSTSSHLLTTTHGMLGSILSK